MDEQPMQRQAQRLRWLRTVTGDHSVQLERASADASARSYWRTVGHTTSFIVMDAPPDKEPISPWLFMRDQLNAAGVRVPAVIQADPSIGFALLEDLGPATLLTVLTPQTAKTWFQAAITQLILLQKTPIPKDLGQFDDVVLQRDACVFENWFIQEHLGLSLHPTQANDLAAVQHQLAEAVKQQPQVLVHSDFMPRNLIPLQGADVAVIDFQDSMKGPIAYDPISLFKDTGISWPQSFIESWLTDYHHQAQRSGVAIPPLNQFFRDADWMGIQRHLKVLGIFSRLHHRDGKSGYLREIPRIMRYLLDILPRYPEFLSLLELLQKQVQPILIRHYALHGAG